MLTLRRLLGCWLLVACILAVKAGATTLTWSHTQGSTRDGSHTYFISGWVNAKHQTHKFSIVMWCHGNPVRHARYLSLEVQAYTGINLLDNLFWSGPGVHSWSRTLPLDWVKIYLHSADCRATERVFIP